MSASGGRRGRRALASLSLLFGTAALVAAPHARAAYPVTLADAATGMSSPIGIDYYPTTDSALVSVNYDGGGLPYNFETVDSAGAHSQFSSISALGDEVYISTIRPSSCQGGFTEGDAFTGNGQPGEIVKISGAGGLGVLNPWVTLTDSSSNVEPGLLRGGLFQDRYCALPAPYSGDLVVTTDAGNVWVVDHNGAATEVASGFGGAYLEGPTTVPNDPKYGPLAGKIVVSDEANGGIWAVDAATSTAALYRPGNDSSMFGSAEGVHVIPSDENFFGVDYPEGKILGAAAADFDSFVGDLLVVTEDGRLVDATWDATHDNGDNTFGALIGTQIADQVPQYEGSTFAPTGLPGLPAPDSDATSLVYNGATAGDYSDSVNLSATLTDTTTSTAMSGATIDFTVGGVDIGTASTDSTGKATKAYTVADSTLPLAVVASYAGDGTHAPASDSTKSITVSPDDCTLAYTGDVLVSALSSTNLRGALGDADDSPGDRSGHTLTFSLTNSAAQAVVPSPTAGPTSTAGVAATAVPLLADTYEVTAASNANSRQVACSTPASTMVTVSASGAKATGGGWSSIGSGRFNFGFNVVPQAGGGYTGEIQVRTNSAKNLFHGRNVTNVVASGNKASWAGTGYWNGASGATFTISVVDNGTGGNKTDTINLVIKNRAGTVVFQTGGTVAIKGGNITVK